MLSKVDFDKEIKNICTEIRSMTDIDDPQTIRDTASRLHGLNYTPPVGINLATFLSLSTAELIAQIERIAALPEAEVTSTAEADGPWDLKLQRISVLVFYFRELAELRRGIAEAWDEVDELYIHD